MVRNVLASAHAANSWCTPSARFNGVGTRVAKAYAELLTPTPFSATTFPNDWLESNLDPRGVGVIVEAEHLCMSLRGVQKPGSLTVTSALRGLVKEDARTRQEFLSLAGSGR